MLGKFLRSYVEGVGSKVIAFVLIAIVAAFVAPILFHRFGVPVELTREVLYGLAGIVALVVASKWHVDVASGGATTTQFLMTQKALQTVEKILPDGTSLDTAVKEILLAMNRAQTTGGIAGSTSALAAAAPSPQLAAVPPAPASS